MKAVIRFVQGVLVYLLLMYAGVAEAVSISDYWFDRTADIDKFQKILLFPIALEDRNKFQIQSDGMFKDYINNDNEKFNKQVKGINFYSYGNFFEEKKRVLNNDNKQWEKIMAVFPDEAARAEAVFTEFAPDGYLVTYINDVRTEIDYVPEKTIYLKMESYTVDSGGPGGYRTYDKKSWTEKHYMPSKNRQRNILSMETTLYNDTGEKILTAYRHDEDYEDRYKGTFYDMYLKHRDEMVELLRNIKKGKHNIKQNKKPVKTIRFGELVLPEYITSNEYLLKSAWFVFKDEAYKMKKVNVQEDDTKSADYYVKVVIDECSYEPNWHESSAYSMTVAQWSQEYTWVDEDGKKRTGKKTYYGPSRISESYGGYSLGVASKLSGTIYLYDNKTDELIYSDKITEWEETFADSYRKVFKEFYKKVDKIAVESAKHSKEQEKSKKLEI